MVEHRFADRSEVRSRIARRFSSRSPINLLKLFPEFYAETWDAWRRILEKLTPAVREFYAICGRGAGKSRIMAIIAVCFAIRDYRKAPGERIYVGVFAPDRKQARITFRYVLGLLHRSELLKVLIEREAQESVDLTNGVTIEVITASANAPRSRSYALAIIDEAAFLPQEDSANPDVELVRAVRPALARVKGSMLAVVGSPYAQHGVLWEAWQRYKDSPVDDVLVVKAATVELNPSFDVRAIDKAREEDPIAAATEYDAQFRSDVEGYVSLETIMSCIDTGMFERKPLKETYYAFTDPAGGSGTDSMTLAIGHQVDGFMVLDALREQRPPFSPESVVAEFSALLKKYGLVDVTGDHYGGDWPKESFSRAGITYNTSDRSKSELYRDSLAFLNSKRIRLLDNPRLRTQISGLERRTARGGRDSIDHGPGGHDDLANVALGLAGTFLDSDPWGGRLVL